MIGHIGTGLIDILDEIGGVDRGWTCLLTCLTKLKYIDVINLIGWFDHIDVGTSMLLILKIVLVL